MEEIIARICHNVNRALCQAAKDYSQVFWDEAPEWQKESMLKGVQFALETPRQPQDMHNNWLRDKLADGWSYGPTKDSELKTHPCMVPHSELPYEQRVKDYVSLAIVREVRQLIEEFQEAVGPKASFEPAVHSDVMGDAMVQHSIDLSQQQLELERHQTLLDAYTKLISLPQYNGELAENMEKKISAYFNL